MKTLRNLLSRRANKAMEEQKLQAAKAKEINSSEGESSIQTSKSNEQPKSNDRKGKKRPLEVNSEEEPDFTAEQENQEDR